MMLIASSCLAVGGECFLEVFCGSAILSLGVMMAREPCLRPWDAKIGSQFNVKGHGHRILELLRMGVITAIHLAVPCISFTLARTVKVRSKRSPEGFPCHTEADEKLLADGHFPTEWAMQCAMICLEVGSYLTADNPFPSFFWTGTKLFNLCGK